LRSGVLCPRPPRVQALPSPWLAPTLIRTRVAMSRKGPRLAADQAPMETISRKTEWTLSF
jgi:hypothetical protein